MGGNGTLLWGQHGYGFYAAEVEGGWISHQVREVLEQQSWVPTIQLLRKANDGVWHRIFVKGEPDQEALNSTDEHW